MINAKKGSFMFTLTAIACALALIAFYLALLSATKHKLANGQDQLTALQTFYEGEKLQLYAQMALKNSMESAAHLLAAHGGVYENAGEGIMTLPSCGTYRGSTLYTSSTKDCYPSASDVKMTYLRIVAEHMNYYMSIYPGGHFYTKPENLIIEQGLYGTTITSASHFEPVVISGIRASEKPGDHPDDFTQRRWTFWPVEAPVSDCFGGPRGLNGHWHDGVDFPVPEGTSVRSVDKGSVAYQCTCDLGDSGCCGGYGNTIIVKHSDDLYTRYAHLSRFLVSKGDDVSTGDVVGLSGNTGYSTGAHLHFSVYTSSSYSNVNDYSQNPFRFLPTKYNERESICPLDRYCDPEGKISCN